MSTTNPTITAEEVQKVAHLARLQVAEQDIPKHVDTLCNILALIDHMSAQDTSHVVPMASSLETATLPLRNDQVTETNHRDQLQKLAPLVESGLYLVPTVIE